MITLATQKALLAATPTYWTRSYAAQDKCGLVWLYRRRPLICDEESSNWLHDEAGAAIRALDVAPYAENWRDSLLVLREGRYEVVDLTAPPIVDPKDISAILAIAKGTLTGGSCRAVVDELDIELDDDAADELADKMTHPLFAEGLKMSSSQLAAPERQSHRPRVTGELTENDIITALELARLSTNNESALEEMDLSDEAAKELRESLDRWGENEEVNADRSWQTVDIIDALTDLPPHNPGRTAADGVTTAKTNGERARDGFRMVSVLGYTSVSELDEGHIDAITNVLHSAHESGLDVYDVLRIGLTHFVSEAL
jgi:hypothetical protein